jgi:putative transposase
MSTGSVTSRDGTWLRIPDARVVPTLCAGLGDRSGLSEVSFRVGGMQMRYRYRIEPTAAQHQMLARVFGCCRVVFNDSLRVREQACRAGIKLSDSEIQCLVITAAKTTAERAWLAEVSSVASVQSVNDSRRAWRNFFDSVMGRRRGRRMGRPKMKSRKDHRQSFRLTRNGFSIRSNGRLFLAKVGEVRVRWSRQLLSEPSSVTIIREPDGHYYASFVIDVETSPLPFVDRQAGVDVGLNRLATVATATGSAPTSPTRST